MISLCSFLYALARTLPCWPQSPRSRRQPSRDWRSWENTLGGLSREALSSRAKQELCPSCLWVFLR